jgi:predicted nucleic acid-binding protein
MTALIFVDTNVLVYARDASESEKQPIAEEWMRSLWRSRRGRLSMQVLQEFYVTVTQKLKPGLPADAARRDILALMAWRPAEVDGALFQGAWGIQDSHRFSFWDSLVVAAARQSGCTLLLTEDLQDGQELYGIRVLNPFKHAIGEYVEQEQR